LVGTAANFGQSNADLSTFFSGLWLAQTSEIAKFAGELGKSG
jgi:hypothetical protein